MTVPHGCSTGRTENVKRTSRLRHCPPPTKVKKAHLKASFFKTGIQRIFQIVEVPCCDPTTHDVARQLW